MSIRSEYKAIDGRRFDVDESIGDEQLFCERESGKEFLSRKRDSSLEYIKNLVASSSSEVWVVGIYDMDKAYGGDEEGGWWYEYGTLLKAIRKTFVDMHSAYAYVSRIQKKLNVRYNDRGPLSDMGSILCDGIVTAKLQSSNVHKEDLLSDYPEDRPYYQ